mmetsp:Transcript_1224/g.5288  ORF Transcript_1224/g.5288 Transcript_1224/m.5288 type:complete len:216 (+) Transcript_1224:1313-1960(+)
MDASASSLGRCRRVPSAHTMLDTACGFTSRAFATRPLGFVAGSFAGDEFEFVLAVSSRSSPAVMSSRRSAPGEWSSRAHAHATLANPWEFMPARLARTRSMSAAKDGDDVTDSRVASPLVCVAMRWMAVAVWIGSNASPSASTIARISRGSRAPVSSPWMRAEVDASTLEPPDPPPPPPPRPPLPPRPRPRGARAGAASATARSEGGPRGGADAP